MTDSSVDMGMLIDTTNCMGCRGCQVACKQWNGLKAERTTFFGGPGYQNPPALSADTFTLITFTEIEAKDGLRWIFTKRSCMHCKDPVCAAVCPVGALHKEPNGAVAYDPDRCMGCRYCMLACPWSVPRYEWQSPSPFVRKCTLCDDRQKNGKAPACVSACPTGALQFGRREELLAVARARIAQNPDRYIDHIYGEKEAGGTGMMYLAAVPFSELGFPTVAPHSMAAYADRVMKVIPWWVMGLGAFLTGAYALCSRRKEIAAGLAAEEPQAKQQGGDL